MLRVFGLADALVPQIYEATKTFPADKRFGLVAQMRRAAVSAAANIVEGCARRTTQDYLRFLSIANGSAYELAYLLGLSARLGMIAQQKANVLADGAGHIAASLTALIESLDQADDDEAPPTRPLRKRKT